MDPERLPRLARLMDLYGALLNERRREILHLYYDEDFSLSEVAEQVKISRQAVHDHLHQGRQQLESFEQQLGLLAQEAERLQRLTDLEQTLERWAGKSLSQEMKENLRSLIIGE